MAKASDSYHRYLFVVNPISGDRKKENILEQLDSFTSKHKIEHKILKTTGENDEEQIKEEIDLYHPDVVVAVGGDGTVNLVARQIVNSDIALGILPMGSGNGLSKDLGIPQLNKNNAFDLLQSPHVIKIDTLEAGGHFFMHLCDIGFNAHIVKLFSKSKSRGLISYIKFTLREFLSYKTSKYKIKTDNGQFEGNAFMITVANSNQFGSNLTINPMGKCNDGLFEVIIIKRFPRKQALKLFLQLLFKRIIFSPHCLTIQCKEAEIICRKKKVLQYDGEIAGEVKKIKIKIHPHSLNVIVPENGSGVIQPKKENSAYN